MSDGDMILHILGCNHLVMMRAFTGIVSIQCPQCNDMQPITGIHQFEWHARCNRCSFGRWTGLSEALAIRHAHGHSVANPRHRPGVAYEPNPTAVRVAEKLARNGVI